MEIEDLKKYEGKKVKIMIGEWVVKGGCYITGVLKVENDKVISLNDKGSVMMFYITQIDNISLIKE